MPGHAARGGLPSAGDGCVQACRRAAEPQAAARGTRGVRREAAAGAALSRGDRSARVDAPRGVRRLGYISGAFVDTEEKALQTGLGDYGWVEGENISIERRFHGGRSDTAVELVAGPLNQHHVELLVTAGSLATAAAKATTSTVPIVMLGVTHPVGQGLVTRLARPAGNITGNTYPGAAARLEAARAAQRRGANRFAHRLSVEPAENRACAPALQTITRRRSPLASSSSTCWSPCPRISSKPSSPFGTTARRRCACCPTWRSTSIKRSGSASPPGSGFPAMYQQLPWVPAGGLMVYVANNEDLIRRGGSHVGQDPARCARWRSPDRTAHHLRVLHQPDHGSGPWPTGSPTPSPSRSPSGSTRQPASSLLRAG